jgi:hypothetical protein
MNSYVVNIERSLRCQAISFPSVGKELKNCLFNQEKTVFSNSIPSGRRKQFFTFEGNYLELLWKKLPLFFFFGILRVEKN